MADLPKAYEPQSVESRWYADWLARGGFVARPEKSARAYSIVIPPPNVTGVLTLGHVLNNTIQDILARFHRMQGEEVLWLPGTDHAGIATQAVVERSLRQQRVMRHREELGRERFLEKVWEWREKHGGIIIQQLKELGCSCDWSRERFTMDPDYSRCVQQVFVDLYKKGRIYRGKRMVNWDPAARTALSDEEVIMREEQGHLWHIKYPLVDSQDRPRPDQFLVVATTRPETLLGDEAVAVHPADPRYAWLVGHRVLLPLQEKPIPVISDEAVDPKFGTGCVKVTPAHDNADYEMALRHQLPFTVVISPEGKMTEAAGKPYAGLDRMEARQAVVAALEASGALLKIEPYLHSVGYSERSHVPIEPYLSEQWFLRYPAVGQATSAVETGAIQFHPDRWKKTYLHWMLNLKDWCISRQLWWGHRIPVWYHRQTGEVYCDVQPPPQAETEWRQDPDVLDTWFSSWLWPFATMGWPQSTPLLRKFYPTTDLVTGPDIIFFWVARMIMAGFEFMGEKPFAHVYFTGIIRDKQGRKMSKSLGNSPDPLDLIHKYGADALRFGIMRSAPLGQDLLYDEKHVELGRNFCNKLWNACRYRQMQAGPAGAPIDPSLLTQEDKWILLRLDQAILDLTQSFESYRFSDAAQVLYRFFWSEYCDWYLESTKAAFQGDDSGLKTNTAAVIDFVLAHALRLFHPFLPFLTEELWHALGYAADQPEERGGRSIMFAPWPQAFGDAFRQAHQLSEADLRAVEARQELITRGRNLRREYAIPSNRRIRFVLKPDQAVDPHAAEVMRLLLNAESLSIDSNYQPPKGTPRVLSAVGELFLPLEGLVDVAAEKARLKKALAKIEAEIEKVERKLNNPDFQAKVPRQVLEEHQKRLRDWQEKQQRLLQALAMLED